MMGKESEHTKLARSLEHSDKASFRARYGVSKLPGHT